jgi:hypothetical protein
MRVIGRRALLAVVLAVVVSAPAVPAASAARGPAGGGFATRWARTLSGPTSEDEIDGVAAAPDGSVYVTGKFERRATLGGVTLTSAGAADIPFARFDEHGELRWAERFGGPGEDNLFDVDASRDGAIGTGWFAGTVSFGGTTLTSSGPSDCVVVALGPDGSTRWARAFGGPGRDGCNEVTVDRRGSVTTSIDTQGGWTPVGGPALAAVRRSDTVLLRLGPDGAPVWARPVGGPGPQRGKALAVAPDGSVAFGGDTVGPLTVGAGTVAAPTAGASPDAWLSWWSPSGRLEWVDAWGGPGADLVKGVVADGDGVSYVGAFTGSLTIAGTTLHAGEQADLLVARRSATGTPRWATSVRAGVLVGGAEAIAAPDGGILFGGRRVPGVRFGSTAGRALPLDTAAGGTAYLARYRKDGTPAFARTIPGTADGAGGEIARTGARVYLDVTLRGEGSSVHAAPIPVVRKDSSVWALDLRPRR